jgi:hypothetical protein
MPSFNDLAKGYANELRTALADERAQAAKRVGVSINRLVYEGTEDAITLDEKLAILEIVRQELVLPITRQDREGKTWILKESDNKEFLKLVAIARGWLR